MSPRKICHAILVLVAVLALATLAGCSGVKPAEGTDVDAILAYTESKADDLFTGMNNNDFDTFSKHFEEKMAQAMNTAAFADIQNQIVPKTGKYVSRKVASIEAGDPFVTVIYDAKFELEDSVTVRMVFENAGEHRIAGLWLDSPKLRGQ